MRSCFCIISISLILLVQFTDLFAQSESEIRKQYLQQILELQEQPSSHDDFVSYHDETWIDWVERTGALPPDFSRVPSLPYLPDPLIMDEGGQQIPVESIEQWEQQRSWIKEKVKYLLSGTFPEPPDSVTSVILHENIENGVNIELIELRFDDDPRAKLTLEVLTPPGDGPFPVFLTQWNHRGWAQIAVRRGYMGVIYAGADSKDDTRDYLSLYPDYDWSTLMARAWGAHRAVDYLYSLDHVDKEKIAITGHSRNGKQSLFAAAFDDRINAVISSSGGTGGEMPYRYTDDRHSNESIDFLMSRRTHWFHPRMRFYIGREHKLPIDQNSLMALVAPNSLLLSSSIREGGGGDAWAVEHMYTSLKGVYDFLNASGRLGIRFRDGGHGVESRDIESYMDWLDIQFGRNQSLDWQNTLYYDYSFEKWKKLSGEEISPGNFEIRNPGWYLADMDSSEPETRITEWENRRLSIIDGLHWLHGEEPAGVSAKPVESLSNRQDYVNSFLHRPQVRNGRVQHIAPYNALGDYLYGDLYYPSDKDGEMLTNENGNLPVVIYLHHFSNTGYNHRPETGFSTLFEDLLDRGIAVFAMDLIGYGQRIEDGQFFYQRYPNWSKLGKMVSDTRAAIDALHSLEFIDNDQIYLAGYSLGGTVSLVTAALDQRVNGVAISNAFTPFRDQSEHIEGTRAYSHLYGLLPRLGFFVGNEEYLPVDFPEIISLVAPRPLYIIAPELDRHSDFDRILDTKSKTSMIYDWYNSGENLQFETPYNFNTFSPDQRHRIVEWFDKLANNSNGPQIAD